MTNILSLPLDTTVVESGNNEDLRCSWAFRVAGAALAYPASTNTGNGTFGTITVGAGTPIGNCVLEVLSIVGGVATFGLNDPDGNLIGQGRSGVPFVALGFAFSLTQGTIPFAVGDTFTIAVSGVPIDITGIAFQMAISSAPGKDILLTAATPTTLINGGTSGILGIVIPASSIRRIAPDSYGFDIIALADGATERVLQGTINIVAGYTFVMT